MQVTDSAALALHKEGRVQRLSARPGEILGRKSVRGNFITLIGAGLAADMHDIEGLAAA